MNRRLKVIAATALMVLLGAGEALAICRWYHWFIPGIWNICIIEAIIKWFLSGLTGFANNLKKQILWNPDPTAVNSFVQAYLDLMQPIFTLSIIIVGFYLVFMSGSPGGRSRAKSIFWKLILAMILTSLSTEIYVTLLNISEGISSRAIAGVTDGSIHFSFLENLTFVAVKILLNFVFILTMISIGMRHVLVLVTAALFPLTIFLYLFDLPLIGAMGRETGAKLFRWTIGVIFAQTIQAIMLAITVVSFGNAQEATGLGTLAAVFVGMAGLLMIACAPLIAMGVLKWIGGAMMTLGMAFSLTGHPYLGFAVTAMGGLMMGQGPGSALMAAGGVASMTKALSLFKT
ncbi:MAG: hypothetical protein JW778_01160 [Candidatus Altiarchaeota archaeon]|nr:hypothetical protein [Candidatus Altiarchaeota archaeon]